MAKKKKKQIKKTDNSNEPLFKFLNPKGNDKFSEMCGIDLQELLYNIDTYYLELRKKLGLETTITFGLELEFENAMRNRIDNKIRENGLTSWLLKSDSTLNNGAEINSPILKDDFSAWNNLEKICTIVSEYASIGKHSGGHIHIGAQVLGNKPESWLNFIKMWSVYENIIFRFTYGNYLCARATIMNYAEPISQTLWKDYQRLKQNNQICIEEILYKIKHNNRYQAVNFTNINNINQFECDNTIEFRCPNATLEPVIWQNNVNFFVKMLEYSKNSQFDDDTIQRRRMVNGDKYSTLKWYGEIYLQQALELCDLVFTNNFDKVYFLRQYLKSFEIGTKELEQSEIFVKKSLSKNKR